jgi:hypothetical protein
MVPVTLDDGTTVMAPAKTAGALTSQQQRVRQASDTLTARKQRWASMGKNERTKSAIAIYNSGGANDPETLSAISDALGLPADLKPKFVAGEVIPQADENGVVQLISKRDGSKMDTGVQSYEVTKETGRNQRRDQNAVDAMKRTQTIVQAGVAKLGDVPELEKTRSMLETYADEKDQEAADLAGSQLKSDKESAAKLKQEAQQYRLHSATLAETIAKAKGAQQGASRTQQPKRKWTPTPAFRTGFKQKYGREPTQADIDAYAAAAQQ